MKLIYIAGPFRAKTEYGVHQNIRVAEQAAAAVWQMGQAALCPHKNSEHFSGICDDKNFLDGDILMLRTCAAVLVVGNWTDSVGTCAEIQYARAHDIPVFFNLEDLANWLAFEKNLLQ